MNIWTILKIAWKLIFAYTAGSEINTHLVHGPPGGGWVGLIDDAVVILLGSAFELSFIDSLWFSVWVDEVRKAIEDGGEYYAMDERERAVVRRWVNEEYPHNIYLYGRISVEDVILLYWSSLHVARSKIGESVFQAVTDIYADVSDAFDVALLIA